MTETGTLAETGKFTILHGSGPGQVTLNELSFHNVGGSACVVRVYWNGVEDAHIQIGPNERVAMYEGLMVGANDNIRVQADMANVINYKLNKEGE